MNRRMLLEWSGLLGLFAIILWLNTLLAEHYSIAAMLQGMPNGHLALVGGVAVLLEAFLPTGLFLPGSIVGIMVLAIARQHGLESYLLVVSSIFGGAAFGNITSYFLGRLFGSKFGTSRAATDPRYLFFVLMYSTAQLAGVAAFQRGSGNHSFVTFLRSALPLGMAWGTFWACVIWWFAGRMQLAGGGFVDVLFSFLTATILWRIIFRTRRR